MATTVPTLVPVPAANRQDRTKARTVKRAPWSPISRPSHRRPSTRPPPASSAPKTPAKMKAVTMTAPVLSLSPRMTESANAFLFVVRISPTARAAQPPTQNPEMLARSSKDSQTSTATSTNAGSRAVRGPPIIPTLSEDRGSWGTPLRVGSSVIAQSRRGASPEARL
jgi:hypothetical protein